MKYTNYISTFFFYALLAKILVLGGSTMEGLSFLILTGYMLTQQYFLENKKMKEFEAILKTHREEIQKVDQRVDKVKTVVDGFQLLRGGISNIR